jgi:hypothetical protein
MSLIQREIARSFWEASEEPARAAYTAVQRQWKHNLPHHTQEIQPGPALRSPSRPVSRPRTGTGTGTDRVRSPR